ncbi:MAG: hypothetical protein E7445_03310 [Ruminococcaceae bacterium]|nr:hypothetical protein [Oscillospiraceae bacterium]
MRRYYCVQMMILCLMLTGCGSAQQETEVQTVQSKYRNMLGCVMEAEVTGGVGEEDPVAFTLRCMYDPAGESVVEVLAPETVAGIRAVVSSDTLMVVYEELCLPAGTVSRESISPAACLPWLMDALRDGWLMEESAEEVDGTPCLRLCLDETDDGARMEATVWIREESDTPVRGEIAVDGEKILTAEFTSFQFYDTITRSADEPAAETAA